MRIGGLTPFSLSDYPGHVASVIFTQGCNFRCPYCYNGELISTNPPDSLMIPEGTVFEFLESRTNRLDGVVICGGEPTLQPDLPDFMGKIKKFGLKVKLDTNGSLPQTVEELINNNLVDFIAMDIKAPLESYHKLAGVKVNKSSIMRSIDLISKCGVDHEFRTTVVDPLLSEHDLSTIKKIVPPGSSHRMQPFRPENTLDPSLSIQKPASIPHTHQPDEEVSPELAIAD